MSTAPIYKLEKDLCRCCHAEGSFNNLAEPVYNYGQREVYSEMLKNSLGIDVSPMAGEPSMMTYTICSTCVIRLRDAHNFKQQVTLCEQRFQEMYKNMVVQSLKCIEIKEEVPSTYKEEVKKEIDDTDDDDGYDMQFDDSDDDQPVIKVKVEEPKKAKPKPKAAKPRARAKKAPVKKPEPAEEAATEESQHEETADGEQQRRKDLKLEEYAREENGMYRCIRCRKRCKTEDTFKRHYLFVHLDIPRIRCCRICRQKINCREYLKHLQEAHDIQPPYCNICQKTYDSECRLVEHQKNVHMKEKSAKCNVCDKKFFNSLGLRKHMPVHEKKTLKCDICNKQFRWTKNLNAHMNMHTGVKRFSCKICPNAFVQKASLNWHMLKHHPEVNF